MLASRQRGAQRGRSEEGRSSRARAHRGQADLPKLVLPPSPSLSLLPRGASPRIEHSQWLISSVGIGFCSLVSLSVSGYSIAAEDIQEELDTTRVLALLGLTTFTMTFGVRLSLYLCVCTRAVSVCWANGC